MRTLAVYFALSHSGGYLPRSIDRKRSFQGLPKGAETASELAGARL